MICKIDRDILRTIHNHRRPMTINEISSITDISWITVRGHLKKLLKFNVVKLDRKKKRNWFELNYKVIK